MYDEIEYDTDHENARLVDDSTGLAAYVVQDVDDPGPGDWAAELQDDAWEQWRNGDVYGVIITGPDQCHIDSLWGIYDPAYGSWETTSYTYQTAKEMLTSAAEQYRQSAGWVAI